jgi:hypothetical protein
MWQGSSSAPRSPPGCGAIGFDIGSARELAHGAVRFDDDPTATRDTQSDYSRAVRDRCWSVSQHAPSPLENSMSYLPQPTGGEFELPPAGTHLAVAYRVIDLGTQKTVYNGKEKEAHKIMISWELPEEYTKDGRPFSISQRYTWSMNEKATLRKHLEAWRGKAFTVDDFGPKGFNIKNIIGKGCLLTITHTEKSEKQFANITAVSKLMKRMEAPQPTNKPTYLWLTPDLWEPTTFFELSQGLQGVVMKSPEYAKLSGNDPPADDTPMHDAIPDDMDDEIPF